jgi:hypothetical protein
MKLIKYYVWERFMEARIQAMRNREQRLLAKSAVLKGVNICLVFTVRTRPMFGADAHHIVLESDCCELSCLMSRSPAPAYYISVCCRQADSK